MAEFNYTGDAATDEAAITPYIQSATKMATLSQDAKALLAEIYKGVLERRFPHLTISVSIDNRNRLHYSMRPK